MKMIVRGILKITMELKLWRMMMPNPNISNDSEIKEAVAECEDLICDMCIPTPDHIHAILILNSIAQSYLSGELIRKADVKGLPEKNDVSGYTEGHGKRSEAHLIDLTWNDCCDAHRLVIARDYIPKAGLPTEGELTVLLCEKSFGSVATSPIEGYHQCKILAHAIHRRITNEK